MAKYEVFLDVLFKANGGSIEDFANQIGNLYPQMEKYGVESAADFINFRLNNYVITAPYNYVSYAMVGGFVSDAQRRFVMAGIANGSIVIPYPRSGREHYATEGSGAGTKVVSDDVSMYYSMDDEGQARMQMLRGWDKIGTILDRLSPDILTAFQKGIQDAIQAQNIEVTGQLSSVAP